MPAIIILGLMALIFYFTSASKRQKAARQAIENKQAMAVRAQSICAYFDQVNGARAFPEIPTSLNLKRDEFALCDTTASLYEYRKQSYRTGGAVRVMKGVYVGGSQQHSYDSLQAIDEGKIIVTNHRLVFVGSKKTSTVNLADLLTVEEADGAMEIHSAKRQKPLLLQVPGMDTALLVLLIKLCSSGDFKGRFLPDGLHMKPATDGDGNVSVSVQMETAETLVSYV
jgi:hypothetical protein